MFKRKVLDLVLVVALAPTALLAQTVDLNPDHPQDYVVKEGDTLWGISAMFLRDPWRWPELWDVNPQIKNPHLIFPGDQLVLTYRQGQPLLTLSRVGGRPTIRLGPQVREVALEDLAVPTIPIDAIQQFLTQPLVVGPDTLNAAPYIVSLEKEHLVAGAGNKVYVRGIGGTPDSRYVVYRPGSTYLDPAQPERVLGYEAIHVADAVLERTGDPATLVLSRVNREVLTGDRVLPAQDEAISSHFYPREPDGEIRGKIIAVVDGVTQIGQHQMVVVSLGQGDGVEVGHVMAVFQAGEIIQDERATLPSRPTEAYIELDPARQGGLDGLSAAADRLVRELQERFSEQFDRFARPTKQPYQTVQLPEERAGLIMVVKPYESLSYALVVDATRPIHIYDTVANP